MREVNDSNVEAWNEEMAKRYDVDQFHAHPSALVRWVEGRRIRSLLGLLAPAAGEKILEVGCGAGHVLDQVPAGNLWGLDLSTALLERAKKRLGARAELTKGNAEALPYPDNCFDKVYCSEVLEHVLHPEKALQEMARVGRTGGRVVISVPHEKMVHRAKTLLARLGLFHRLLGPKRPNDYAMPLRMQDEWHLNEFSLPALRRLIPAVLREERVRQVPLPGLAAHFVVAYKVEKSG